MMQAFLKKLYNENVVLKYKSHLRGPTVTWTTYTIESIDAPVEYDKGDHTVVYDVGSSIKIREPLAKKLFPKHCMLYPMRVINTGRIRVKYIALQDHSLHSETLNEAGEIVHRTMLPPLPEEVTSVTEASFEAALSETSD